VALWRETITPVLAQAGIEVVAHADGPDDLLRKVRSHSPNAAVIDFPEVATNSAVSVAALIRHRYPETAVLVLSEHVDTEGAAALVASGAERVGYLLKGPALDAAELIRAVDRVVAGGSAIAPKVVSELISGRASSMEDLSPREREVLELLARGLTNQGIAERLVITKKAVEKHVGSVFRKLRLASGPVYDRRVLAVHAFLRSAPPRGKPRLTLAPARRDGAEDRSLGRRGRDAEPALRLPARMLGR
jgi:DNA-binding NarL/FixJ family response regulator